MKKHLGLVGLMGGLLLLLLAALPLGLFPRWRDQSQQAEAKAAAVRELPQVASVRPTAGKAEQKLRLPATLSGAHETEVRARADGYVRSYTVDIGDQVTVGQVLVQLEAPELEESLDRARAQIASGQAAVAQAHTEVFRARAGVSQAQADIKEAEAGLQEAKAQREQRDSDARFARRSNERWQDLVKEEAVSLQEADQQASNYQGAVASLSAATQNIEAARSRIGSAQARLQAAKSEVGAADARVQAAQAEVEAQRAEARRIERQLDYLTVRSPLTGVVTMRGVEPGALVSAGAGTPLYKLASVERLRVFVDVPQSAATGVAEGVGAVIHLPGSTRTVEGKVRRTTYALDESSRTLRAEIGVENDQGLLAPGMAAEAELEVPVGDPGWMVPAAALSIRPDGPRVVVVEAGGVLRIQKVRLGADLGKEVQILDGLQGTETLVVLPTDTMADGQKVTVKS